MPLAISWQQGILGGREVDDYVSLTDLAPTFLQAAITFGTLAGYPLRKFFLWLFRIVEKSVFCLARLEAS